MKNKTRLVAQGYAHLERVGERVGVMCGNIS